MEKTIIQASELNLKGAILENYDDIILTPEETAEALRKARKEKHYVLKQLEYAEKLRQKSTFKQFDYESLTNFAVIRGKEFEPDFTIDEQNKSIFHALALYFAGDVRFEALSAGFSLRKGILLAGGVGCGKTTLMRVFSKNSFNSFNVVSCRKVADDFSLNGAKAMYSHNQLISVYAHEYFGQTAIGTCFDDLGTEQDKAHFGNRINVMADVILNRYDRPELKGKTHITTNLTGDQIEAEYGLRVRSRMREMFNVLTFSQNAGDRRK